MEIRQLRADEYDNRMELSQFAFQFQISPSDLESRRLTYKHEQDWGVFDEQGSLQSALRLIPLEAWIQGKKFAMGGIASVATWPEARRQGCVSKLLVHALETMKRSGQSLSMLHPFAFAFYRKFGYELTIERKKYTMETDQLPRRLETSGQVKRMPEPDIEILNTVYDRFASRYSGNVVRTEEWWKERILDRSGRLAVYYNEQNEAEGYIFYHIEKQIMTVHEYVSTSENSRVALWTYIANHDSMITEVSLIVPTDDQLPFLLSNPRIKQEVIPYFMSRIVDAQAFVSQYPWAAATDGASVLLTLSDAYAPWNNGTYRLSWNEAGTGELERSEEAVQTGEAIECDIQSLTAILAGGRKPSFLRETGRISGPEDSIRLLESRIPERLPYLMDFF
ncbi:enhanced intracellular survival protein Eis [Paenibacillus sp. GCM10012307]|uniref:GNAT family N-acetyltransferase n=1 Tax=Paenibacillus roseus TaxID=2798579 RepID=A0A934J0G2_9BACL|nr:GNAT family N-acetyltransferase [Paenibacillus roseus]MBJ6362567.1 GNAT family N-acetyltransferase [Paenibacillus roseus]